jgi:hypothetical protein
MGSHIGPNTPSISFNGEFPHCFSMLRLAKMTICFKAIKRRIEKLTAASEVPAAYQPEDVLRHWRASDGRRPCQSDGNPHRGFAGRCSSKNPYPGASR